jgi:hypothetical protein
MTDTRGSRGPVWCALAALVLVLPALYVLSVGPTRLLVEPNSGLADAYRTVYAPVIWLANNVPSPIDEWLSAYIRWWDQWR